MDKALADHLIALKANRLRPGMYVAELDRLWLHTPFPPGGFYIRDTQQIERICRYCTYVYVDPASTMSSVDLPLAPIASVALMPRVNQHNVAEELPWARQALGALHAAVKIMVHEARQGRLPDTHALSTGLGPRVLTITKI